MVHQIRHTRTSKRGKIFPAGRRIRNESNIFGGKMAHKTRQVYIQDNVLHSDAEYILFGKYNGVFKIVETFDTVDEMSNYIGELLAEAMKKKEG